MTLGFVHATPVALAVSPRARSIPGVLRLFVALGIALGLVGMLGQPAAAASASEETAPLEIDGATTVDAEAIIALIGEKPNLVILDNRREGDYENGHIEGAVRLLDTDIDGPADLAAEIPSLDTPTLFYCNGVQCGRAANAVRKAVEAGYTNVYYYALGMTEWEDMGLPVVSTR